MWLLGLSMWRFSWASSAGASAATALRGRGVAPRADGFTHIPRGRCSLCCRPAHAPCGTRASARGQATAGSSVPSVSPPSIPVLLCLVLLGLYLLCLVLCSLVLLCIALLCLFLGLLCLCLLVCPYRCTIKGILRPFSWGSLRSENCNLKPQEAR